MRSSQLAFANKIAMEIPKLLSRSICHGSENV